MKTRFLRKAKSALSILLTLCVLISCMSLGISSADAATAKSRTEANVIPGQTIYYDISNSGVPSWWTNDTGTGSDRKMSIKFGDNGTWADMTYVSDTLFSYTVPSGTTNGTVYFGRGSSSQHWNSFSTTYPGTGKICFYQTGQSSGSWGYKSTTVKDHYFYFDNSGGFLNKTNKYLVIGHDSFYRIHKLTQISGTNLYYCHNNSDWGDSLYVGVFSTSTDWQSDTDPKDVSNKSWANDVVANADGYKAIYSGSYSFNDGNSVLLTASSNSSDSWLTPTYLSGYSTLNSTLTIKTALKSGTTYSETNTKYGTFSASNAKNINGNGTSTNSTVSQSGGTGTLTTARTNTATISQAAVSGYTFKGWKAGSLDTSGSNLTTGNYSFTNTGSASTVYAYYERAIVPLTKPTWSSTSVGANAGTAATLTISNHSDIKTVDSGVTYVLKKGNTTLTSGTDYTFNNSTGVFTLTDTTTAAAGSYTVQAIAANTASYSNSEVSSAATVTVYEPQYCIVGNYLRSDWNNPYLFYNSSTGEYDITPDVTIPSGGDATYFNTWQPNYVISNPTGTPGVYSLTFKINEPYDYNPKLCLYLKNTGQKAFVYNGTPYNTSSADITVPDSGISSGLYAYDLAASDAGGALVLKPGQTYTITIDQTQRYNNNSPYGKITITATDAYVDTVAKKKTFNATSRTYNSVENADDTIGTVTAVPYHGTKGGFTSTLTATVVNNGYTFTGWYTSADCSGTPVSTSASYDVANPNNSITYYALFTQTQPAEHDVNINSPSGGTITLSNGVNSSVTPATAYEGATVSMSINVTNNGKEFSHWKITATATSANVTSSVLNSGSTASSASFTMPAYNVTVTAILNDKTPITINTSSNNPNLGSASYDSGTYYVGSEIQLRANNGSGLTGGVFTKWQITGANFKSGSTAATQNPVIIATGATVTAKAIFEYRTYQLDYNGTKYIMLRDSNGKYISTRKVNYSGGQFTIYDLRESRYAVAPGNPYELHSAYLAGPVSSWDASSSQNKYRIKSSDSGSYYVRFDPTNGTNGTVDIVATNPMGDVADIYAKDGSIRYTDTNMSSGDLWEQSTGGPTCNRGVTQITKINGTTVPNPDSTRYPSTNPTLSDHLKIYSAPIGTTLTIQTTVNTTYKNQGFYVGMFVINGWKVAASDMGNGVYSANYTLDNEYSINNKSNNKSFEITPVYYNKNFEYITFYVDAESVPSKWGETISACADYNGATNAHFEGTYPGQPLGREGDLYELKVAKYYYNYANSKWTAQTNYHPSATITAYNFDLVHHYYYVKATDSIYAEADNDNFQTYDFSDFAYLARIENIEAILFKCKYETSKSSWQIYNKSDSEANYNATTPAWYNVDGSSSSFNSWQVLTDYYGNPIDALGNRITKSGGGYYTAADVSSLTYSQNSSDRIRIVSYGNRNTNSDGANSRTAARWSTGWAVYGGGSTSGTNYQIAYGNPADFICTTPGTDSTSSVHYINGKNSSALKNKITYITYDKERKNFIDGVGDTGERIDGQWYYSAMHDFDSEVKVAITTGTSPTTSNTDIEVNSNSEDTGYIGTTSGTTATLDDETVKTYSNVTTDAELSCTPGAGYSFVGWYIFDGSTYTKIGDNYADLNTTMLMKKNYTIVAVVKVVPAGSLLITHTKYTGSSPEAGSGTGKYYVSAVVNPGTASERTIPEAQNSIAVSGLLATDKLQITLRTVCNGDDTFYAWYEEALGDNYSRTGKYYEICNETEDPMGEKEVSYEFFPADCAAFFSGDTLTRKTLDFYSDITHVSAFANLTYKYYDRFAVEGIGKLVSYVVKNVELTTEEIEAGYIPTDEKIQQYAPDVVDTIYRDTKWTIIGTKVQRTASNITLMATQEEKECYVQYIPSTAVASTLLQSSTTETAIGSVPSWTNTTVKFNSWLTLEEKDMTNWDPSDFIVSAPESYTYESGGNSTTWNFVRFDVYSVNRNTGAIGNMLFSVNDSIFGYRIYNDCVIYPVYTRGEVESELTANIEPAVLNREVYGESTSPTDKLYADLIVSFINTKSIIGTAAINEFGTYNTSTKISQGEYEGNIYTVETGVILDRGVNLSVDDYNFLKTQGTNRDTDYTNNILSEADYHYPEKFNSAATIAAGLKADNITFGKAETYGNGFSHNYIKYLNNNSLLTDKNRLDKVIIFTNNEKAQKAVFAAYSYIIITNTSSGHKTVAVSDPQLFNFAYVGNKPLTS